MVEFLLTVINGISAAHFLGSQQLNILQPASNFQYLNFLFHKFLSRTSGDMPEVLEH